MKIIAIAGHALVLSVTLHADPVFQEKGGLVVMEAESTSSRLGSWEKKTDVADYSGECHLEFTGNKPENGPPKSPLKYTFRIEMGGKYELAIRCRKRLETKRQDISNDCFVALKGDFGSGGDVPLKVLKSDTKLFGGAPDRWGWSDRLDVNHKKFHPVYELKAGETYELTVSGRSKNFNIDRILFVHKNQDLNKIKRSNPDESRTDAAGLSGSGLRSYPTRKLKNKEGRVIEAKLVEKEGDTLTIIKDGRRFEIAISSLSEEDQQFLKDWRPE